MPTLPLLPILIKTNRYLVHMKDPLLIDVSSRKYKLRYKKEINKDKDSTVYTTEYRSKKIQHAKPVGPGTGQLVPKSTRTLVNSYPFLVNSYLSQLVPKSTRTLVYL